VLVRRSRVGGILFLTPIVRGEHGSTGRHKPLTACRSALREATETAHDQCAMYEKYNEPLAPRRVFWRRVAERGLLGVALLLVPLIVGIVGYMGLAGLGPVDAFLNAAMILGGMGPVDPLPTDGAKVFAGIYALFAGIFYLVVAGVILQPFLHRVMHLLHVPGDSSGTGSD
jgi:hypothetical protein